MIFSEFYFNTELSLLLAYTPIFTLVMNLMQNIITRLVLYKDENLVKS